MSRVHPTPEDTSCTLFTAIEDQVGIVVQWGGVEGCSIIYSPASGYATFPSFVIVPGPDGDFGNGAYLDYNAMLDNYYGPVGPVKSPELAELGATVKYIAIKNADGAWVATRLEFLGLQLPLYPSTDLNKNILKVRVTAVVNRVDKYGSDQCIWLWNDYIGRICCPRIPLKDLEPFDVVNCIVEYKGAQWKYGGEDVPWLSSIMKRRSESDLPLTLGEASGFCGAMKTSDDWEVVISLSSGGTSLLVRGDVSAFAQWNDFSISTKPIGIGEKCRVTYAEQLGDGMPFLRALLVTRLDKSGKPESRHPHSIKADI